jgi:hypothetical protein
MTFTSLRRRMRMKSSDKSGKYSPLEMIDPMSVSLELKEKRKKRSRLQSFKTDCLKRTSAI